MSQPRQASPAEPPTTGLAAGQAPAHTVLLAVGPGAEAACLQAWAHWRQTASQAAEAASPGPRADRLSLVLLSETAPQADALRAWGRARADGAPWAEDWARQCWGLSPGFHRLQLEQGRLQLTLCIGPLLDQLRELQLQADHVHWGVAPEHDPSQSLFKAMTRLCRRGATLQPEGTAPVDAQDAWRALGYQMHSASAWVYQPAWEPRRAAPLAAPWPDTSARDCVVVGGGLAGLGTAHALARRGWQVTVLDAAAEPAQGASGLPAGLFSPHVSPDHNRISRLTRTGLRLTRDTAQRLLSEGQDWAPTGVMEHRVHGKAGPRGAGPDEALWSHEASADQKQAAGLPPDAAATWHPTAGWVRPARLVTELLAEAAHALPGRVQWRGGCRVARLQRDEAQALWQLLDEAGQPLARAALVVIAAGPGSRALCEPQVPLQALRGQLSWAVAQAGEQLPPHPVNGQGSLIPHLPVPGGQAWYTGSTFDRGHPPQAAGEVTPVKAADHDTNLSKLAHLLPATAASLRSPPGSSTLQAWAGIRCTAPDRVPLVGPVAPERLPGVWACTALGTRGLTWGLLCAELLAAQLSGEPLPIELSLARALQASRPAPGKTTPLVED